MRKPSAEEERASAQAHAWLARLHGDPGPRDRAEFELWYAADPAHRQAYDRVAADWKDRYALLAQTSLARNRVGLPKPPVRTRPLRYGLVAAAVAIFFLSTLLLFRPGGEAPAEARIVSTRLGEIRTVTLEDDSRVTLDTDSRIAIGYGRVERRVELQAGRARFFVRKAPRRPFIVQADGGQVVVLGTTFDVSVVGAGATVSLLEGAAEVIVARTAGEARIKLRPGQRVSIGSAGLDPAVPLPEAETKWPTGMLEFRSTPLRRVIAEANRYSSRKIRLVARGTGDLRVTGTFRAGDTAGLARSLATAFGLRVENGGRGGIVLHPPG